MKQILELINKNQFYEALNELNKNKNLDLKFQLSLKAVIFQKLNQDSIAIKAYRELISKNIQVEDSLNDICIILYKRKKIKILKRIIKKLLSLKIKKNISILNVAKILNSINERDLALKAIDSIKEDYPEKISFKAAIYKKNNMFVEAINLLNHYKEFQNNVIILQELASCYGYLDDYENAIKSIDKAILLNSDNKTLYYHKALFLFSLQRFKGGLKFIDFRFVKKKNKEKYSIKNKIWKGEAKENILIWSEDGIGDHILYLKLIFFIKNVKLVYLEIDKRLHPLIKNYLIKEKIENIKLLDHNKKHDIHSFDAHLPAASLMKYTDVENLKKINYLYVSPPALKIKNDYKKKIGIAWKTLNTNQTFRNIPFEMFIKNIHKKDENYKIYNLQFGDITDEINYCRRKKINFILDNQINYKEDITSVANIISEMDAIITCQNSVAHLASAMGKKTILILTKGSRWYWQKILDHKYDFWYQNTLIFKVKNNSEWSKTVSEVLSVI